MNFKILILTQHLATSFHVGPSSNRHVPMSYHCHVIPPQLLPGLLWGSVVGYPSDSLASWHWFRLRLPNQYVVTRPLLC